MATSQVIDNDLNPKWNEDFKLLVHEPEHQVSSHTLCVLPSVLVHVLSSNASLPSAFERFTVTSPGYKGVH